MFVILPKTSIGPVRRELPERSKYINLFSIDHDRGIVFAMFGSYDIASWVRSDRHVKEVGRETLEVRFRFAIKLTVTTVDPEHVTPYGADSPAAPGHGHELLNAMGDHVERDGGLPKSE